MILLPALEENDTIVSIDKENDTTASIRKENDCIVSIDSDTSIIAGSFTEKMYDFGDQNPLICLIRILFFNSTPRIIYFITQTL